MKERAHAGSAAKHTGTYAQGCLSWTSNFGEVTNGRLSATCTLAKKKARPRSCYNSNLPHACEHRIRSARPFTASSVHTYARTTFFIALPKVVRTSLAPLVLVVELEHSRPPVVPFCSCTELDTDKNENGEQDNNQSVTDGGDRVVCTDAVHIGGGAAGPAPSLLFLHSRDLSPRLEALRQKCASRVERRQQDSG